MEADVCSVDLQYANSVTLRERLNMYNPDQAIYPKETSTSGIYLSQVIWNSQFWSDNKFPVAPLLTWFNLILSMEK